MSRRTLGKYEVIDRIGRGGMAEVYRGYHAALDRYVAIKLLHPFLADDPEFKERFEREARNVARLKHPNIVQVYDFEYDAEGESYYMVMEYINGPTLKDRLFDLSLSGDRLPPAESIRIIKTAAQALAYAHEHGMIHRDVKPANLMLDEDGRVVLTDFGIAKILTGAHVTSSGGTVGTPAYMSPEQGLGEAGDERSDIYSLGVILYQLVTGRLPYDAATPLAIILKHVNEPLPSPRQIVPDIPEDLEAVICKALAKAPHDRFQSAAEFAEALDALEVSGQLENANTAPIRSFSVAPTVIQSQSADTPILSSGSLPDFQRMRLRKHYLRIMGIAGIVIALLLFALAAFGRNRQHAVPPTEHPPVAESLSSPTAVAAGLVTPVPAIPVTSTQTASPTPSVTASPSPTLTATFTPSPSATSTPDLTGTAAYLFFERQTAATPTPDMTKTLAACDLEYIVVAPDKHNVPPSVTDVLNPRLVRANSDFSFEMVLQNTGTCAWPAGVRLSFNADLTENPDRSIDLTPLTDVCGANLRPGLNFARQQQSNFFIKEPVAITENSPAITFTGTAPRLFGCYFGVWELFYPDSDVRIGRPLVLAIRAWGGG
ncbi:MAG: protein kinase domain-containing protein [Aggregatilineaceae bacterium]